MPAGAAKASRFRSGRTSKRFVSSLASPRDKGSDKGCDKGLG